MDHKVIFWNLLKAENKPDYINRCITEPTKISNTQKRLTKRAILWLLSKGSHTVEDISDHFEISPELVKHLIEELIKANFVVEENGCFPRYQLSPKQKESIIKYKKTKIKFPSLL